MEILSIPVKIPEECNIIIGQSHFIKTVEDLYETIVGSVPHCQFGLAFCEASGACLVRTEGNDTELQKLAADNALAIAAGHMFIIIIKNAFPINILNDIKRIPEVCRIFCATANPLEILVVETAQGRGIIGVVDGSKPLGVEKAEDITWRKELLRKIGYKR